MLSQILSKRKLKLLQNLSSNQGWQQCHSDSPVNKALSYKTGTLRNLPSLGIKELLALDKSLHFSRSERD